MAFPHELCAALEMPLAADYRTFDVRKDKVNGSLFQGPWYSILANIYGISRNEVEQREKKKRARRRRITVAITGGVMVALATTWMNSRLWEDPPVQAEFARVCVEY